MSTSDIDATVNSAYWNGLIRMAEPRNGNCVSIVVTHLVQERPNFLKALNAIAPIAAVIPKPRSTNISVLEEVQRLFPVWKIKRDGLLATHASMPELRTFVGDKPFILLDIGGYFANLLDSIETEFPGQLWGVAELTENGHRRYEQIEKAKGLPCPVYSTARSPLKEPEDFLIGESVIFSSDAVLREINEIMVGKIALVIGYGKVGQSIARRISGRGLQVMVYDIEPARRALAFAHGFSIPERQICLRRANLIFCASGNKSMTATDFELLSSGTFVFSVTSSDDEFIFLGEEAPLGESISVGAVIKQYTVGENRLYIVNDGNAVNFLHGGVVGPFVYLVQSELLLAARNLGIEPRPLGSFTIKEVKSDTRRQLARHWISHFGS